MNGRLSFFGFILLAAMPLGCGSKGETAAEATTKAPKPVPIRDAPITLREAQAPDAGRAGFLLDDLHPLVDGGEAGAGFPRADIGRVAQPF